MGKTKKRQHMYLAVIPPCRAMEDEILHVECVLMSRGALPEERYAFEIATHSLCDRRDADRESV